MHRDIKPEVGAKIYRNKKKPIDQIKKEKKEKTY